MSDKYIIKNCPACYNYEGKYGCEDNHDAQGRDTYCECITDCVMKKIVQVCNEYSDKWEDCDFSNGLSDEILELLDIQEVE